MGHDVKAENACDRRVELICSDDFDNALKSGSERCIEIEGTIKERDKANYATFYDIMLRGNPEMESISDKRKSTRTPQEEEAFNAFRKRVRSQYRMVRDFIFVDEDESVDGDGVNSDVPKKLSKLVETIANVAQLLEYTGNDMLFTLLRERGVTLGVVPLEDAAPAFASDSVRDAVKDVFDTACEIQGERNGKRREITESVFDEEVPKELQYDKDVNPVGITRSDFAKLVSVQTRRAKALEAEAREKVDEKITDAAEEKRFEIERSRLMMEKYSQLLEAEDVNNGNG